MDRKYYEAYDDRYRQVHGQSLQWFSDSPSPIVGQILERYAIDGKILEIGCGEGRDGGFLMERGFDVLATDVSPAAIDYARQQFPAHGERFRVLDCLKEELSEEFDFIYAVAVIHMLVPDEDRDGFYRFIGTHLAPGGRALICTMGDGCGQLQSDIATAFDLQERIHGQSGRAVSIAGTSCRVVSWETFLEELARNGLDVIGQGLTAVEPDFPQMMYAVVEKGKMWYDLPERGEPH